MSTYWNHTTYTGLYEGRNRGQTQPFQDGGSAELLLARSATDGVRDILDPDTGDVIGQTDPQGPSVSVIEPGQEDRGLYPAVDTAPTAPDRYYRLDATTPYLFQLTGPEFQGGTTVERTHNWVSWTIDEIYDQKVLEVGAYDQQVRYNAVDTSLAANWWIVATQAARFEILGIATASNSRQHAGQGWPTGPNAPWLGIYNAATGEIRRQQVTSQGTWDTIEQEVVLHDQATGNATDASRSALDAAYNGGAGDINDVRNHDPADPAWGYPPTVSLSEQARALLGGE